LKKRGVCFGTDFILKACFKSDISVEILVKYIRTALIPNLNELRALDEFADEDAVLLMGNCPSHLSLMKFPDSFEMPESEPLIQLKSFSGLIFSFWSSDATRAV
jgi:hypothetical protein